MRRKKVKLVGMKVEISRVLSCPNELMPATYSRFTLHDWPSNQSTNETVPSHVN